MSTGNIQLAGGSTIRPVQRPTERDADTTGRDKDRTGRISDIAHRTCDTTETEPRTRAPQKHTHATK
eukprot:3321445-Prymnesium_polylepis.1